ncbi:MAG: hypothetical protein JSU72_11200 [Deltaproteobacteria bacterium]|nr:MAG: hypothetical protein JSU72_11200 [Deltaproteobacteria bacterium]
MGALTEKIVTKRGIDLLVEKRRIDHAVEVALKLKGKRHCLLHWGLRHYTKTAWHIPPQSIWPKGTRAVGKKAVETPFIDDEGERKIVIRLDRTLDFPLIEFVLFFADEGRWDDNGGRNYQIEISTIEGAHLSPMAVLREESKGDTVCFEHLYRLESDCHLAVEVSKERNRYHLIMVTDTPGPISLHWGVAETSRHEWHLPSHSLFSPETTVFRNQAAETPFVDHAGWRRLHLKLSEPEAPLGIVFTLRQNDTGRWLKDQGRNFYVPVAGSQEYGVVLDDLAEIADEIIDKEVSRNSWTLMHRFNLCHDLLDRVRGGAEGLALIFVWLRFSAIRQLDWQRDYNTKPRELSHAQDRLTHKLAHRYGGKPEEREFIRLMLSTLGPGSDGQRIRDEILKIMHRHHIKEVTGHFMEEWHQKLHNNATPDDVVICEAYLEFLRSDGNLDFFYRTLEAGGVTKKRLESYERPITTAPDFLPHLKEPLINDFEHYLGILRSVHSGTDLGAAINAAKYLCDAKMCGLLDHIWSHKDDPQLPLCTLVLKITEARLLVQSLLEGDRGLRDLLYLDLALEDLMRRVVERNLHTHLSADQLVDLIGKTLVNLRLSQDDDELGHASRYWHRLAEMPRFGREWSLQAKALLDRLQRALAGTIDHYYRILQPKAEFLGRAFHADSWTIVLFSEEVVRGRPAFVLSALLRLIDPELRRRADLGTWQVVSPGQGAGQVEVVTDLRSIQGRSFAQPTVVVAETVAGDEEIPERVVGVLTVDMTDTLSHVAVRARNNRVLFATCYDLEMITRLKMLSGRLISIGVTAAGDVTFEECLTGVEDTLPRILPISAPIPRHGFTEYAVSAHDFSEKIVGSKSNNLRRLQGKLPEWICLPSSVAMPFGVFEKVLDEESNKPFAEHYGDLIKRLDQDSETVNTAVLAELRETILSLKAPEDLISSLRMVMQQAELPWSANWEDVWMCITRVWSSKWNEGAYLSRRARGISHADLVMAVLIQQVVEADYSFVIHTVNPSTDNRDELYAEVVLGLGETLVGNYPGRALSFTCRKGGGRPELRSFPSKSVGLFGKGLIFRSDSSGEDLAGYAGAGLYDSVMLEPPQRVFLDYAEESLVWREDFRSSLLGDIARIGTIIEEAIGSPQDIEGACTKGQYFVVQTRPQMTTHNE